ncbi:hypothetical protein QBC35DRAFT_490126 [Podospora australis]|uniref:EH domain-containing protein n=1 Tax=Podospora australis TaxID=1536484 RepID=A0AAN7AM05_9PEZI|nr:hypothetical protein QBC35DRAFT_490126 [Podospora australis]
MQNSTSPNPSKPHRGATSSSSAITAPAGASVNPNAAALAAALKGATHAFNHQKTAAATDKNNNSTPLSASRSPNRDGRSSSISQHRTGAGADNGALLAATQAVARDQHSTSQSQPRSPSHKQQEQVHRHGTGASSSTGQQQEQRQGQEDGEQGHSGLVAQRLTQYIQAGGNNSNNSSTHLAPPTRPNVDGAGKTQQGSASFIAATLAASRSNSPTPNTSTANLGQGGHQQHQQQRGRSNTAGSRRQSVGAASILSISPPSLLSPRRDALDTESIKPTTSLVSMFEGKRGEDMDPVKKRELPPSPRITRQKSDDEVSKGKKSHGVREMVASQGVQGQDTSQQPSKPPKPKVKTSSGAPGTEQDEAKTGEEATQQTTELVSRRENSEDVKPSPATKAKSPPARPPSRGKRQPAQQAANGTGSKVPEPAPQQRIRPSTPPAPVIMRASTEVVSPQPRRVVSTPKLEPPAPPPARNLKTKKETAPTVQVTAIPRDEAESAQVYEQHERASAARRMSQSSTSSDDTFVSASSGLSQAITPSPEMVEKRPPRPPPPKRRASLHTSRPATSRRPSAPNVSTPNLGLDSLTHAMVASNLASTRCTPSSSPAPPPVPLPRRHNNHRTHSPLHPQRTAESLTSQWTGGSRSPNRHHNQPPHRTGMLQTLRAPHKTSVSDDEATKRRHHHRKGKLSHLPGRNHAHHEGSRRRWRDEVSARERRRYEAVWASNRGLFLKLGWGFFYPSDNEGSDNHDNTAQVQEKGRAREGPEAELVVNLVVRDIWSRSRLPADELAEVWELVDREKKGALGRDEFVVGMWLIDQRLRGRKIPARVGESVWESVRGAGSGTCFFPLRR